MTLWIAGVLNTVYGAMLLTESMTGVKRLTQSDRSEQLTLAQSVLLAISSQ